MPRPSLKIATFNLYNLQLPDELMYHNNRYDQRTFNAKIRWTAEMLKKVDADVIGFQELWHPDALSEAFDKARLLEDYTLVTKLFGRSIATALAVRKEHLVGGKTWIKNFPSELVLKKRRSTATSGVPDYKISVSADYFARPVLRVRVKPSQGAANAPEITFFVAHFKSKLPMSLDREEARKPTIKRHASAIGSALSTIRRTAEAAALRVILNKEMKGNSKPVVVMGDLNDTEHSVTNTLLTGDPSYRLFVAGRAGSSSDTGLYSVSSLQEYRSLRDVNYTHIFKGRNETLDHILVSEQFYDYSKKRKWSFKQSRVFNDFLEDDSKATSDHGVVVSEFLYHPAK